MDFLLNKVLKRLVAALMGPLSIYSAAFFVGKQVELINEKTEFVNYQMLAFLFGTSVVVQKIGLYITLRPIELLFDWLLWIEPGKTMFLKGNFAPIDKELSFEIEPSMIKGGTIPNDVNGVYLRNGPNPTFLPPTNRYHWFDGDGHIHGVRIKNGRAYYCNRQTQSTSYKEHRDLQRQTHVYLGSFDCMSGLFQAMFLGFEKSIGWIPDNHEYQQFGANTAITHHAKRTFALIEADHPFQVQVEKEAKEFDIKSIGYDDFDGQLKHHVSAHPKVDRKTGHLMAFSYSRTEPFVNLSYFDKNRFLINYTKIQVTSQRFLHDFCATENYVIIPDLPMESNPDNCMAGKYFYQMNKKMPARYGILRRGNTNADRDTKWFELPCHFVFHYANAWEDTNKEGEEIVVLYGARANDEIDFFWDKEHPFLGENAKFRITRFEFNMKTGKATEESFAQDLSCEFPVVNGDEAGYKTRYLYFSFNFNKLPDSKEGKENLFEEGFLKFDTQTNKVAGKIVYGHAQSGGEIFFAPRDNATSEDDGYCMSFVHNWESNSSQFVMWDSKTMSETPALRVALKQRVPHGFHGVFIQENQLM